MTNKEAVKILKDNSTYWGEHDADKFCEAYDMAIKALEQEPILDKIRAEIEQVKSIMNEEINDNNRKDLINFVNGLNQTLIIVERYKAESEDNFGMYKGWAKKRESVYKKLGYAIYAKEEEK